MGAGESGHNFRTSEFGQWFEGSEVVDEDGQPKVMYHGTNAEEDFRQFEFTSDIGFHFGSPGTANARLLQIGAFEHARIIPVFLSIKSLLRLPDLKTWEPGDVVVALAEVGVLSRVRAQRLVDEDYFGESECRRALEKKGYDGIVYLNSTEGGGDSYIALRPEQIRSALSSLATLRRGSPTSGDSVRRRLAAKRRLDRWLA